MHSDIVPLKHDHIKKGMFLLKHEIRWGLGVGVGDWGRKELEPSI